MFNARWTTAVDIWSLGATLIFYILRRHIFVSDGVELEDENFHFLILVQHIRYFGPFPEKFYELLDEEATKILRYFSERSDINTDEFSQAPPEAIHRDDREFIRYLMRPDPRDRPTAKEALAHPWFKDVC